jgi:hypothetical protein
MDRGYEARLNHATVLSSVLIADLGLLARSPRVSVACNQEQEVTLSMEMIIILMMATFILGLIVGVMLARPTIIR